MRTYVHATFLLISFIPLAISQLTQNQETAMKSLSVNLNSSLWNTTDSNPCNWNRVNCTQNSITHLNLSGLGLSTNPFLIEICQLDSLQSLDLSQNLLTSVPHAFFTACGERSNLKSLNLSMNMLNGSLPPLQGSVSLETLDLSFNFLGGNITSQLHDLVGIKSLNLSFNSFIGPIPHLLGKSMGLEELRLSGNYFEGAIPEEIFRYRKLRLLCLSFNRLEGSVSNKLGELSKLEILLLSSNNFSGRIPESLLQIKKLSRFRARQNRFTGPIPRGILEYVEVLDLSYNSLSGTIPSDLLSSPNLWFGDLSYNSLGGPIPVNLSKSLLRLRLGGNSLIGSIPPSVGNLSDLMFLEMDGNMLTGAIPLELGKCRNLMLLNLGQNQLQGLIPKELSNLQQLEVMKLDRNELRGEIPNEISQLKSLMMLNLGWNSLTGAIPSAFSNLTDLSILNLEGNQLNGSIPNIFSKSKLLLELLLGNNNLSGEIPRMPSSLRIALNLSSNHFHGPIPVSLKGLSNLEVLDLSDNEFTGEVPQFLTVLQCLTILVLSNNQLSGTLPQFNRWVNVVTTGNDNLIRNPTIDSSKGKATAILLIAVAVAGAILGLGAVAVIFVLIPRRSNRIDDENIQSGEDHQRVIDRHLITRDSNHCSSINFTRAMEAVSNPANIFLKSGFSTYYKAIMPCGMSYSVKKLDWSDNIFQLGSHERFRQELGIVGGLSSSRVMAPLAYVLTADSAYLFYEHAHKGTLFDFLHKKLGDVLDWPCRHSIALGVAQGLAFLHGCIDPVLLLDLSTKTILLKSMNEPQIADVELFKVIDPSKSTASLSTIAGSVGYIPPEYAYTMRVTMPGNVYSFGVILLELLTGKPPVSGETELAKWVLSNSVQNDAWEQILDSSISKTSLVVRSQMLSVLKVALCCVSTSPDARPIMKNVVRMLLNAR
ncbi:LRR receptor-like serine/threonine-protein kinase GSO1 [Magnolia sinica]|uniref:LRR receptor-like serine/threonine-protein kinase GSO1 n=1 Tax=Magnolia sinica TaxID=86752 RepID=UPI00265B1092|nr:LRR receptor-like serine/threonine-protein kinase GSO1 [Magnolia sinica]